MAKALKLPKTRLSVISGHTCKDKKLLIQGLTLEEAVKRLTAPKLF